MKNRLLKLSSVCGFLLVFTIAAAAEEGDRPGKHDQEGVSDRREQFRNASPEERRRMMEKRRDSAGPQKREGRPGMEGRHGKGGDMQNRMLYHMISNPERAAKIGVSEEQVNAIKQQLDENEQNMRKAAEEMKALFRRQAELMSGESINEEELMAVVEQAGERQTALAKMRIKQLMIVKNSLTPDQITKLKEMFQEKRRKMSNMGSEHRDGDKKGGPQTRDKRAERPQPKSNRSHDRDKNLNAD